MPSFRIWGQFFKKEGILKSCPRVLKLHIWLLRDWGRWLKVTLQKNLSMLGFRQMCVKRERYLHQRDRKFSEPCHFMICIENILAKEVLHTILPPYFLYSVKIIIMIFMDLSQFCAKFSEGGRGWYHKHMTPRIGHFAINQTQEIGSKQSRTTGTWAHVFLA